MRGFVGFILDFFNGATQTERLIDRFVEHYPYVVSISPSEPQPIALTTLVELRGRRDALSKLLWQYEEHEACKARVAQGESIEVFHRENAALMEMLRSVLETYDNAKLLRTTASIGGRQALQQLIFEILKSREETSIMDISNFICPVKLEGCAVFHEASDWALDLIARANTVELKQVALGGCAINLWSAVVFEFLTRRECELSTLYKIRRSAEFYELPAMISELDKIIRKRKFPVLR